MNPILVVDDDEIYRELVMLTLQDHCEQDAVHGFASAQELRRHLDTGTGCGLVLLDLHMPDVAGLELLEEIRTRVPGAAVAVLSGAADEEERQACLRAGAVAFLRKPVAYTELVLALQGLLRGAADASAGRSA